MVADSFVQRLYIYILHQAMNFTVAGHYFARKISLIIIHDLYCSDGISNVLAFHVPVGLQHINFTGKLLYVCIHQDLNYLLNRVGMHNTI